MLNHAQVTDEHILLASWSGGFSVVSVDNLSESIRLVDDGFSKICNMMNDISMRVRANAASLLVSFTLLLIYCIAVTPSVSLFYLTHFH